MKNTTEQAAEQRQNDKKCILRYLATIDPPRARNALDIFFYTQLSKYRVKAATEELVKEGKLLALAGRNMQHYLRTDQWQPTRTYYITPEHLRAAAEQFERDAAKAREEDWRSAAELTAHEALRAAHSEQWQQVFDAEFARLCARYVAEPYRMDGAVDGRWCVVRNNTARNVIRPMTPDGDEEGPVYGGREKAMAGAKAWCELAANTVEEG